MRQVKLRCVGAAICASLFLYANPLMAWMNCENAVNQVGLSTGGVLSVMHGPGDVAVNTWNSLCYMEQTSNGVTPTACRQMYGMLLTARATGGKVIYSVTGTDCSATTFPHTGAIVGHVQTTLK